MSVQATEPTAPSGQAQDGPEGAQQDTIDLGSDIGALPVEEVRNGYLRQRDYTRKTQELASQRQEVALAHQLMTELDRNPEQTLKALQEAYGVQAGSAADELGDVPPAVAQKLKALEDQSKQYQSWQQQQARQQAEQYLNQQLQTVQTYAEQVGLTYDEDELLQFATRNNLHDLQAAYLRMNADNLLPAAQRKVQNTMQQKRQLVAGRSGLNGAQAAPNRPAKPSVRQALSSALEDAGVANILEAEY